MALPAFILRIDFLGEIVSAVVSLLIAYYAHRAYRLSRERPLFLLYIGFLLIGVGFVTHALSILLVGFLPRGTLSTPALVASARLLQTAITVGTVTYWALEIIGYLAIFVAYIFQSKDTQKEALSLQAVPPLIAALYPPFFELIMFVLTATILVQVIILYVPQRHHSTFYVVLGFLFLSLAHLAFIFFPFSENGDAIYVFGHTLQLAGFLLLLAMLLSTTRRQ